MASTLAQLMARLQSSAMGQPAEGADNILLTDTSALASLDPPVVAIQALTDTTFTTLTGNVTHNDESTAATGSDYGTLIEGSTLYGNFTAITLATGSVMCYR